MATKDQMARLEARRRFIGATQQELVEVIGISRRAYVYWLQRGTTQRNYNRAKEALKTLSKP